MSSLLKHKFLDLTLRKKMNLAIIGMLFLIFLMLAGGQVIMKIYNDTSQRLIIEFHEQNSLYELKNSLRELENSIVRYDEESSVNSTMKVVASNNRVKKKLSNCIQIITTRHDYKLLDNIVIQANKIDSLISIDSMGDLKTKELFLNKAIHLVENAILELDPLLSETEKDISDFERIISRASLHGTYTILFFGLILMFILLFGGSKFIDHINRPIQELVDATQKISSGNIDIRIHLNTKDEFSLLADSFNDMLDALNKTTYSELYLKNIIDNLFGALLVTDRNGKIVTINSTTTKLFGYDESELLGEPLTILFDHNFQNMEIVNDLDKYALSFAQQTQMHSKTGEKIPVYVTCTVLKNTPDKNDGLILVGHDQSEVKEYEARIKQLRKDRLNAINEAQEEERIRIAKDIHDGLGQMLTAISYSVQNLDTDEENQVHSIKKIQKQIDATIIEAKNIAHDITPMVLNDYGLIAALNGLVEKMNQITKTEFRLSCFDFEERLAPGLEKAIYRICQESMNNIIKHASAKMVAIELFATNEQIVLVIEDDGVGFNLKTYDQKTGRKGIGLISIRERVNTFDGIFTIDSEVGRGTNMIIEIPRKKNS